MPGPDTPIARLSRSLDTVHEVLRSGDLAALPAAAEGMECSLAVLAAAGARPSDAAGLAAIRRKLERNALCLQGSARGIRAARRRIAEVRAAGKGLAAYDAAGRRPSEPAAPTTLARRF
jgi:hypothetical protein